MPDTDTQRLLGQYGAEIRELRQRIEQATEAQERILKSIEGLKEDIDQWHGASRTIVGIATAVAAILGATISHFIVGGISKLFGLG